jgi:hypothetical protein
VLLAYVDESYCDDCYYVVALLCPDEVAPSLAAALDSVIEKAVAVYAGVSAGTELHGHEIFHGRKSWAFMKGDVDARIATYRNALEVIADHDVTVIARGVQTSLLTERYGERPVDPHALALSHLLERIDRRAFEVQQFALVIADELDGPAQSSIDLIYVDTKNMAPGGIRKRPEY